VALIFNKNKNEVGDSYDKRKHGNPFVVFCCWRLHRRGRGVLFAPRAGAKTRALLGDKIGEGTEYLSTKGQEIKDQAVAFMEKGKRAIVG
jgi:hypothetical protein